jgi:hypothetical protein
MDEIADRVARDRTNAARERTHLACGLPPEFSLYWLCYRYNNHISVLIEPAPVTYSRQDASGTCFRVYGLCR